MITKTLGQFHYTFCQSICSQAALQCWWTVNILVIPQYGPFSFLYFKLFIQICYNLHPKYHPFQTSGPFQHTKSKSTDITNEEGYSKFFISHHW